MEKNIAIKATIVTIVSYAFMALESALSYWMSEVMGWTWYIQLCNGLTYTQIVQKALTTPWMIALMAFEMFVLVPAMSTYVACMWYKFDLLTRATEN